MTAGTTPGSDSAGFVRYSWGTRQEVVDGQIAVGFMRWKLAFLHYTRDAHLELVFLSTRRVVQKPVNHRGKPQWRGLSVAELAKSSGFPGKSPEVYATSATNFP